MQTNNKIKLDNKTESVYINNMKSKFTYIKIEAIDKHTTKRVHSKLFVLYANVYKTLYDYIQIFRLNNCIVKVTKVI